MLPLDGLDTSVVGWCPLTHKSKYGFLDAEIYFHTLSNESRLESGESVSFTSSRRAKQTALYEFLRLAPQSERCTINDVEHRELQH